MRSLIEFIQEQDQINYRRLRGYQHPWTDDPIMAYFKFGNVRREFDRTNRLLYQLFNRDAWSSTCGTVGAEPLRINPRLIANCLVHRLVSCHDFSERHGLFADFEKFQFAYLDDRVAGLQVRPTSFTSCMSDNVLLKSAKLAFDMSATIAKYIVDSESLESCFFQFKKVVGKFTAWQASLDCVMHGWVKNTTNFVHMGPGAEFTLRALDVPLENYPSLFVAVNDHIQYLPLRFEEVEGLLCEYGRYIKYNTKWPGKYRNYTPDPRPLKSIPLDKTLISALEVT